MRNEILGCMKYVENVLNYFYLMIRLFCVLDVKLRSFDIILCIEAVMLILSNSAYCILECTKLNFKCNIIKHVHCMNHIFFLLLN
jgi:hypothetical protein